MIPNTNHTLPSTKFESAVRVYLLQPLHGSERSVQRLTRFLSEKNR